MPPNGANAAKMQIIQTGAFEVVINVKIEFFLPVNTSSSNLDV